MGRARSTKRVRQIIEACEAQGFTVRVLGNGHVQVRDAQTNRVVASASGSASDYRADLNFQAALRRAGFEGRIRIAR